MDTRGRHVIAELDGCDPDLLAQVERVRDLMIEAARAAGATPLADSMHEFAGGGVSGFVLLAESHISIHTWPEHGYAAVDIYTCGAHTMPDLACGYLAQHLGCEVLRTTALDRGVPGPGGRHEQVPSTFLPRLVQTLRDSRVA
jgi:S-adenosylmethionine decarboxylase